MSSATERALAAVVLLCACGGEAQDGQDERAGCFVGDRSEPVELEVMYRDAAGTLLPLEADGEVPLIEPPQGGKVLFIGARARNLDGCGARLRTALVDPESEEVIAVEQRSVQLEARPDGWLWPKYPHGMSNYSNLPACPHADLSRAIEGNPHQLVVTVTDRQDRKATTTLSITPVCGEPELQAVCHCECAQDYTLGGACVDADGGVVPDAGGTRSSCERPLIIGYRGSTALAPENTLPAFEQALAAGADGIEVDVQSTRDGVLIAFHDDTTERTAKGQPIRTVAELTYDEVAELDVGIAYGERWRGTRVPTLDEVLALTDERHTVIFDLKANVEAEIAAVIEDRAMAGRAIVSGFSEARLARFHELLPDIPIQFCMQSMDELELAPIASPTYVRIPRADESARANWDAVHDRGYELTVTERVIDRGLGIVLADDVERALLAWSAIAEDCR